MESLSQISPYTDSNTNSNKISIMSVPVSVSNSENLVHAGDTEANILKVKENNMDVDEVSKGSSMDVDSLMKDDLMDVDLEDHMDVDNELINSTCGNGLETIHEKVVTAAPNEELKEVLPSNKENEDILENVNNSCSVSEGDKVELNLKDQQNLRDKEVLGNDLEKSPVKDSVGVELNKTQSECGIEDFVTDKGTEKVIGADEDLIKFNETVEGGENNIEGTVTESGTSKADDNRDKQFLDEKENLNEEIEKTNDSDLKNYENNKEILKTQVENRVELNESNEILGNDKTSRDHSSPQVQNISQMNKNIEKSVGKSNAESNLVGESINESVEIKKCLSENRDEAMDVDIEENLKNESSGPNIHQKENNIDKAEGGRASILEKLSKEAECAREEINSDKNSINELEQVPVSDEENAIDSFTELEPEEVICSDLETGDNDLEDEAPCEIVATATLAPNEFENLVSVGDVNADEPVEEGTKLAESHNVVHQLSDLAMKVVLENEGNGTSAEQILNKIKNKPIQIKTIKEEKLDFNFEGESSGHFQDQKVKVNLPSREKASRSSKGRQRRLKKKSWQRNKRSIHNSKIKSVLEMRLKEEKQRDNAVESKNSDTVENGEDKTVGNSEGSSKRDRKSRRLNINRFLNQLRIDMNDTPVSKQRTRTRSSITEGSRILKETSPTQKRTAVSLPPLRTDKRALRPLSGSPSKIETKVKVKTVQTEVKMRNVAMKSTTPRAHLKNDFKIVEKKFRNVARKRGQPYFKDRSEVEPAPIFVDTNFGSQDIDMFINENEDDELVLFYDSRSDYDRLNHSMKIRNCKVVVKRIPGLERLLPKKTVEKICELCEPKRVFLSKAAYVDHFINEHVNQSSETVKSSEVKVENESNSCSSCKKFFHSKNRLAAHMKTCKLESSTVINQVPGVDLRNLGNVTISISSPEVKKSEEVKKDVPVKSGKHVCSICGRKFLMATGLNSHMRSHKNSEKNNSSLPKTGKFNLTCNICDKKFNFCSDLVEHITFHSLTSEKEKDILLSNFKKISNIQINLESIPETESSDSETDNLTDDYDDSSDYSFKAKMKTTPKIYFAPNKCFECARVFTIKAVYERHVGLISKTVNLKDQTKCPVCDLEIKFRCKLGGHLETHKPQTEEQLICKKCNKTFRCENNLIRHELEHEGKLKVNCQYCSYSFHSMSDLYAHQEECKLKCSEYKCNLCERVFTAKWRLDLHMKTDEKHGTDPQQPNTYFCDQCGREFKHLSVLKRHVDSRCGTEPLFECPDCDKKYFSQGSLASHKRTQHSTEKNFMCQYCSKDFFTKHQLHRHELRHNPDIRPYRCKYPNCVKTYRQPDSLRAHECEHTGLYPYVCEFCGLQFSNVKSLKLHRKSSNHWSDVEPNKVVTQACRQKHAGKKLGDEQKFLEEKVSEEDEIDPEGHEDEPKNLVINESQYDGVFNERIAIPQQVPQYSNLQPFTVNHLMQSQQSSVLVQSAHPLATYTQAIENYFVIASQQEPMPGTHHALMN